MLKLAKHRRVGIIALALVAMAALWGHTSDLAYQIAQQRPVLLGRYTESYFLFLLASTAVAAWLIFAAWKKRPLLPWRGVSRITLFKMFSLTFFLLLFLFSFDLLLRFRPARYYEDPDEAGFYRRLPHQRYTGTYHDLPAYPFSYPDAGSGAPPVPFIFSTDAFGFRNQGVSADRYSWLAIGDSFTEGSQVSDQEVWVDRLQSQMSTPLYNCGISGGSPLTYLSLLQVCMAQLEFDGVLCMLYEGNDFRASNFRAAKKGKPSWYNWPRRYVQSSPLRRRSKRLLIKLAGNIGSQRFAGKQVALQPKHPLYSVSWLPMTVAGEHGTARFAFDVKRLADHLTTAEEFKSSTGARETMRLLKEIKAKCQEQNKKLVLLYAPDAPHVLMELMAEKVPAKQINAFLATRRGKALDDQKIWEQLLQGSESREKAIKEFCEQENIGFLSLTPILKQATSLGRQTYFCYDQHWTPVGHEIVADYLSAELPALSGAQNRSDASAE